MAASFPLWETKPLRPNLFRVVGPDTAVVLVKLVLVLKVVALADPDLLVSQTGDPADDLVVGAPLLGGVPGRVAPGDCSPGAPTDPDLRGIMPPANRQRIVEL